MSINGAKYIKKIEIAMKNISPLHIGDSQGLISNEENSEIILFGTSMAGAFRSYLEKNNGNLDDIFGKNEQSKVFFYDSKSKIKSKDIRTGNAIDEESGTAKSGALFDRCFFGQGHNFKVKIDIFAQDKDELELISELIYSAINAIDKGFITLGSYKSVGSGSFKVETIKESAFDIQKKSQLLKYIKGEFKFQEVKLSSIQNIKGNLKEVKFILEAEMKTPLLIKGQAILDHNTHDSDNIKNCDGKYIIPGSSIKGIIRAQAKNILKYHNKIDLENKIFGCSGEKNIASKITCFDSVIENVKEKKYNFIKIDKFTGGAIKGALASENTVKGNVKIESNLSVDNEKLRKKAVAAISLVYRDLALQKINLGSGYANGKGFLNPHKLIILEGNKEIYNHDFKINKTKTNNLDLYLKELIN